MDRKLYFTVDIPLQIVSNILTLFSQYNTLKYCIPSQVEYTLTYSYTYN